MSLFAGKFVRIAAGISHRVRDPRAEWHKDGRNLRETEGAGGSGPSRPPWLQVARRLIQRVDRDARPPAPARPPRLPARAARRASTSSPATRPGAAPPY